MRTDNPAALWAAVCELLGVDPARTWHVEVQRLDLGALQVRTDQTLPPPDRPATRPPGAG